MLFGAIIGIAGGIGAYTFVYARGWSYMTDHAGAHQTACAERAPDHLVISFVEGWRGEICHVAGTDSTGRLAFYKIVDPSFHNWVGLAMALRDQQISNFPLCNKSFNLSYCGHDG
jgi:Ni,Fe-hydrogenase III large subunit